MDCSRCVFPYVKLQQGDAKFPSVPVSVARATTPLPVTAAVGFFREEKIRAKHKLRAAYGSWTLGRMCRVDSNNAEENRSRLCCMGEATRGQKYEVVHFLRKAQSAVEKRRGGIEAEAGDEQDEKFRS